MNWSLVYALTPFFLLIAFAAWGIWGGRKLKKHDPENRAKPTTGITFLGR